MTDVQPSLAGDEAPAVSELPSEDADEEALPEQVPEQVGDEAPPEQVGDEAPPEQVGDEDGAPAPLEAASPSTEDDAATSPGTTAPVFRVMEVDDVSLELPAAYPTVTLVESEPPLRALVFPVGVPEGTAMAQALRRLDGRRPMTHELFMRVLQRARIDVIAVRLTGREEGNLLAELDLMTPTGRERIDCRPSDGIVLALRMPAPAPVLVDERLLEESGDVAPVPEGGIGATGA